MNPIKLAEMYMDCFFGRKRLDSMEQLLARDMIFQGPLFEFSSAQDYLKSLKADPPRGVEYRMIRTYSDETSVCFIYEFSKPGVQTTMVQTFEVNDGKITKINLVFDPSDFT